MFRKAQRLEQRNKREKENKGGKQKKKKERILIKHTLFIFSQAASSSGLPRWLSGKESAYQCRSQGFSLGREDPLEEEMATTPVFLPGKCHGPRSLATVMGSQGVRRDLATKQRRQPSPLPPARLLCLLPICSEDISSESL